MRKNFQRIVLFFSIYFTICSCAPKTHTVVFIVDGEVYGKLVKVKDGDTIEEPVMPTSDEWEFEYWYDSGNPTSAYDFNTPITADLTLYAKIDFHTIRFVADGHEYKSVRVKDGVCVAEPDTPTSDEWGFLYWCTDLVNPADTVFNFDTPITADLMLYAKIDFHTVKFIVEGSEYKSVRVKDGICVREPDVPTSDEWGFEYWCTDLADPAGTVFSFDTPITEDLTLYARTGVRTVQFIVDGDVFCAETVMYNGYAKKPNDYGLNLCWYKDPDLTTEFNFNTEAITSNTSIYADACQFPLYFKAVEDNSFVKLCKYGDELCSVSLEYSRDLQNWQNYTYTIDNLITLDKDEKVYFRAKSGGNGKFSIDGSSYFYFNMDGKIEAYGNIMSLLDNTLNKTDVCEFCFINLFRNCYFLIKAPSLPAVIIKEDCYANMFVNTAIETMPELPAEILATECYAGMFGNCTNLKNASALPATKLAPRCYEQMFTGCTSLETSPELLAETLAEGCCHAMFRGCSNLSKVEVNFTEWKFEILGGEKFAYTANWLLDAGSASSAQKQFICPAALNDFSVFGRCESTVPEDWQIITK